MILSELKQNSKLRKRRIRVGRGDGSGKGKTSGRGSNGARSRSGRLARHQFAGGQKQLFRRLPKRGFSNVQFARDLAVINISDLAGFEAGSTVGPDELKTGGVLKKQLDGVKVLGGGVIAVALTVRAHAFSQSAVEKIEAAGGKTELIQ